MNIVFVESLGMCECTINKSLATLKNQGHTVTFYHDRNENEEVLIERARNAEVVVVSNIPLRKHFFENCPKLRMLSVAFTGVDHIDLEACKKRGITVCNAAGYSTEAVAELTIGMMIAVYRKMVGGDAILRIGGDRQGVLGSELHGKTVGIVGLGAIGQRVALLANAFGCKVLGYNRSPKALPHITQVDKDTLLRQSDIITVHLPLNPETKAFIGTNEFALMQPHAVLINTARGSVVDEAALYDALLSGRIGGAVSDVFRQEPYAPSDKDLRTLPNMIMTPHIGSSTREACRRIALAALKNIRLCELGDPLSMNLLNPR